MKKMLFAFSMAGLFLLSACSRPAAEETETAEMTAAAESTQETSGVLVIEDAGEDKNKTISVRIVDSSNPALPGREAKKVRGIYITGPVAGNEEVLNSVLDGALTAGINAVVIDFKEDQGRITCPVDAACQYPVCTGHEKPDREPQEEGSLCDRASRGLQGFLSRGE